MGRLAEISGGVADPTEARDLDLHHVAVAQSVLRRDDNAGAGEHNRSCWYGIITPQVLDKFFKTSLDTASLDAVLENDFASAVDSRDDGQSIWVADLV